MSQQVEAETPSFHLESIDCVMKLPVVEAAYNQSASVYEKIKGANYVFHWALTTAEATVQKALETATPLAHRLDKPVHMVDQSLVRGIQALQVRAPIVTQEPKQIYEAAKTAVTNAMQPTIDRVYAAKSYGEQTALTLKELSWNKANELLTTHYGQMAITGVDSTSALVEKLIDYYFPTVQEEEDNNPISAAEDPVLHTVQTVGRLSNKAARRVYRNVSNQLKNLNVQDTKEYVSSLIAVLQLTRLLHHFNQNAESSTGVNSPPTAAVSPPTNESINGNEERSTNVSSAQQ